MPQTLSPITAFQPPPVVRSLIASGEAVLVSRRVAGIGRERSTAVIAKQVAAVYRDLSRKLARSTHQHLARIWNGIPGIHDRLGDGDRYMAFNAGRYAAMRELYGDDLVARAPAASGVGIDGDDLVIHALTTREPPTHFQNPQQTPAMHYSERFGRLPPCFARATLLTLDSAQTLFIAGTAAITGEATMHVGDPDAQLALTLQHLRTIVAASGIATTADALAAFTSLRVYLPSPASRSSIGDKLSFAFPNAGAIEFVPAQLCRRDLLVEIEGIATNH